MSEIEFDELKEKGGADPAAAADILAYDKYKLNGGTLSFVDWKSAGRPTSGADDAGFVKDDEDLEANEKRVQEAYQDYALRGGTLTIEQWKAAGTPETGAGDEVSCHGTANIPHICTAGCCGRN